MTRTRRVVNGRNLASFFRLASAAAHAGRLESWAVGCGTLLCACTCPVQRDMCFTCLTLDVVLLLLPRHTEIGSEHPDGRAPACRRDPSSSCRAPR